jgi:hypothetical protein
VKLIESTIGNDKNDALQCKRNKPLILAEVSQKDTQSDRQSPRKPFWTYGQVV